MARFRVLRFPEGSARAVTIKPKDKRLEPAYSVEEAADFLRIPASTLYAWTIGRKKPSGGWYEPILRFVQDRRLSFFDLAEAQVLRAAVERKVPLQQIRRGLEFLRERHPEQRPLLHYDFLTDGKFLLVSGMVGKKPGTDIVVNASTHGQLEWMELLKDHLQLLRGFDEHFKLLGWDNKKKPNTIFPKTGGHVVSITSGVYSGRPVVEGTRIPTTIIAERYKAGETIKELARDYHLSKEKIEAAISYETAA